MALNTNWNAEETSDFWTRRRSQNSLFFFFVTANLLLFFASVKLKNLLIRYRYAKLATDFEWGY